jgi:hypothetical protein
MVIGYQNPDFPCYRVIDLDQAQWIGAFILGLYAPQFDGFIPENMAVLANRSFPYGLKDGISFYPANKIDSLGGTSAPKLIVGIAPVVRDDGPGAKENSGTTLISATFPSEITAKVGR